MGFSSYTCPNCDRSLLPIEQVKMDPPLDPRLSQVILLTPEKNIFGTYDGYQRIYSENWLTRYEINWREPVKIYHQYCWELKNKPSYDEAKEAKDAPDQGWFIEYDEYKEWPRDIRKLREETDIKIVE